MPKSPTLITAPTSLLFHGENISHPLKGLFPTGPDKQAEAHLASLPQDHQGLQLGPLDSLPQKKTHVGSELEKLCTGRLG